MKIRYKVKDEKEWPIKIGSKVKIKNEWFDKLDQDDNLQIQTSMKGKVLEVVTDQDGLDDGLDGLTFPLIDLASDINPKYGSKGVIVRYQGYDAAIPLDCIEKHIPKKRVKTKL